MKVTITGLEYFNWGVYGGFGMFTRKLATELVKHGVEVEVFVSRTSKEQKFDHAEYIDGVKVITTPRIRSKLTSKLYDNDSDIVHEQYNPLDTFFAFRDNPDAGKVVTVQDLRTFEERKRLASLTKDDSIHFGFPTGWKRLHQKVILDFEAKNMNKADVVACHAHLLEPKISNIFDYRGNIVYLPNFVDVSSGPFKKSDNPSVVWLARLDPVKNPLLMFQVAKAAPDVDFYVLGQPTNPRIADLVSYYKSVSNLHFLGHQEGNVKEEILSKAWILINTSFYECMPVSFLEALAHKCCLLSTQNPDGYTEKFGYYDSTFTVEGLVTGLRQLIRSDDWRAKGENGYIHVKNNHATEQIVQKHLSLYRRIIK